MKDTRYTPEERLAITRKFERRKCSAKVFCKKYGISKTTIYIWLRAIDESKPFIPLAIKPQAREEFSLKDKNGLISKISSPMKISRHDLTVDLGHGCDIDEFRSILEVLNAAQS